MDIDIRVTEKERDPGDAKILVIGVGGGGNNALNRMISQNIANVEYIAVNTDLQDLNKNLAPVHFALNSKRKLANNDKTGLGAGGKPEVAQAYAEESAEEIEHLVEGANMVFITAGMGGGTGTGAAPVIARISKSKGILTVAVVTKPFWWEGDMRIKNAERGIAELKDNVDTLFVIPNDKLEEVAIDEDTDIDSAFYKADQVLMHCITGITNIIRTTTATMNLDFADIETVMRGKGYGHVGVGQGEGDNKVDKAIESAMKSPLLETSIVGARSILVNFVGGKDVKMREVTAVMGGLRKQLGEGLALFFGIVTDESMSNKVYVTLIATDLAEEIESVERTEYSDSSYFQEAPTITPVIKEEPPAKEPEFTYVDPSYNYQPQQSSRTQNTRSTVPSNNQRTFNSPPNVQKTVMPQQSGFSKVNNNLGFESTSQTSSNKYEKPEEREGGFKRSSYIIPDFLRRK